VVLVSSSARAPCVGSTHVFVVVQYTPNIAKWSPQSYRLTYQNATTFWFIGGNNIHLYGGGTIDGNGQVWYDQLANGNVSTHFLC
jgi:galacturan 1,4-alpha-galacturonidase